MISVFDIETQGWDRFVLGGWYDGNRYESFRDEHEFFNFLVDQPGELWTFNGGRYDMNWFCERAKRSGVSLEINMAGSRITNLKRKGQTVRDLAALMPFMDLKLAATIAGIELDKNTGLVCRCDDSCGGYCAIKIGMSQEDYKTLDSYLYLDCYATYHTKLALDRIADECGYLLTGTIGGSTWKTAQKFLGLPDAEWETWIYRNVREAFYGGRCQVFRPQALHGHAYDLNSAYPAALHDLEFPIGEPFTLSGQKAVRAFKRRRPGFYLCDVTVPEMFVPPLPLRAKNRIVYPVGSFTGRWSVGELAYAEEVGCKVNPLTCVLYEETAPIFRPYMERVWANRHAAKDHPALKSWHKTFGNSLYGKLGEGPERTRYHLHPPPEKVKDCKPTNRFCTGKLDCERCTDTRCCGKSHGPYCKAWTPIDRDKTIFGAPYFLIPANGHSHWAAYLTAHTRIEWHRMAVSRNQGEDMLYGDTDSIYAIDERDRNIGDGLGQWGREGRIADFCAIAPKMYEYTYPPDDVDGQTPEGPWRKHARAKGLSGITWQDLARFKAGEPIVVNRGVKGLRSAAKSGSLFQRKLIVRSNKQNGIQFGDRLLRQDGRTYPVEASQIACLT